MPTYLPRHFEPKSEECTSDLIRSNPFATLVSIQGGEPLINHLPLLLEDGKLLGHLSARNPQASIPDGASITAIFHGPHAYITPQWYAEHDVPTWNYAVVHAVGKIRWRRQSQELIQILRRMTEFFEAQNPTPWPFALPEDLRDPETLARAIVGFEIEIEKVQAKFKLSQNRSEKDQQSVIRGLRERGDAMSLAVADLMENQT